MAVVFLDTSALLRRYRAAEPGSAEVKRVCRSSRGNTIVIAQLASVEVASALNRWVREGTLVAARIPTVWRLFLDHRRSGYKVVGVSAPILAQAERLLFAHPLRAYDAVHIASALAVAIDDPMVHVEFWTADRQQAAAALAQALEVRLLQ